MGCQYLPAADEAAGYLDLRRPAEPESRDLLPERRPPPDLRHTGIQSHTQSPSPATCCPSAAYRPTCGTRGYRHTILKHTVRDMQTWKTQTQTYRPGNTQTQKWNTKTSPKVLGHATNRHPSGTPGLA